MNCPGIIVHLRLTVPRQVVLLRGQHAEWRKELLHEDLENHSKNQSFRLVRWLSIIRFLQKITQDSTSPVRKFFQESSWEMCSMQGASGKEILWSQTLRSSKTWTRQKFMLGVSMQRKSSCRKMVKIFMFPVADGTVMLSERDQVFQKIHFNSGTPCTRRRAPRCSSRRVGRVSTIRHTNGWRWSPKRFLDCRWDLFSSSSRWTRSFSLRAEWRVIPNTARVHWRGRENTTLPWLCCWKAALTIIGTLMVAENCRSHGPVSRSSQCWMKTNLRTDTCGPGERNIYGQRFCQVCRKLLNLKKNSSGPLKRTMQQNWCHLFHRSGRHGVQGHHEKRAQKVGVAMESATPCKVQKLWRGETCGENNSIARRSKLRMHRGGPRIYEKAHWKDSTKRSLRSHCWEGV